MERIYSLKEVAEILGISNSQALEFMRSGVIRGFKVKAWKATESALQEFIKAKEEETAREIQERAKIENGSKGR